MPTSPALARLLLRVFLPRDGREHIIGDLEELFAWRCEAGVAYARRWYRRAAVASIAARWTGRTGRAGRRERGSAKGGGIMRGMGADVRYAWRGLTRRPGFAVLAVLTLAIGIGANTMVFAMANQALFRPVPGVSGAERAVFVELLNGDGPGNGASLSSPNFEDLRAAATMVDGLAGFGLTSVYASVDGGLPVEATTQVVEGDYFTVLGVRPLLGRLLTAAETERHADPSLAVISEELWAKLFARDAQVVGRTFRANRQTLTVIGVAANGFRGPYRDQGIDVWLPISALVTLVHFPAERMDLRDMSVLSRFVARLKADVAPEAAEAQLATAVRRLIAAYPEENESLAGATPRVYPDIAVQPLVRERTRSTVRILLGVVALVLVIACANVANLLLLRGSRRRGEIAVRRALGASRGHVFSQLLSESLMLAAMGGLAGLIVALGLSELFRGERMVRLPAFEGLAPDARVLGFAVAAALATGLLAGVVPALLAGRIDFAQSLREAGRRETAGRAMARSMMTVVQIALSLALLVGALLLTRTIRNLYAVDLGIDPSPIVTFAVNAIPVGYSKNETGPVIRRLHDELSAVPGVDGLAFDLYGPFWGSRFVDAIQPDGGGDPVQVTNRFASPGYFETLGIPLALGRGFRAEDWNGAGSTDVVLTQALARRLFGDADPVGRTVTTASRRAPQTFTVIGVSRDLHLESPLGDPDFAMWRVLSSLPLPLVTVMVRTDAAGPRLTAALRDAVFRVMPEVPIDDPVPLAEKLDQRIGEQRLFARLLGLLSGLAVLLAAIGLYGVIAWTVAERTREIGIRMALGARVESVAKLVLGRVATLVLPGIALGLGGAVVIARLVESQLFGVKPVDASTYAGAAALFALVAIAACIAPTRAATRVDPVRALRRD